MRFREWVSRHGIHKHKEEASSMTLANSLGMHCDSLKCKFWQIWRGGGGTALKGLGKLTKQKMRKEHKCRKIKLKTEKL